MFKKFSQLRLKSLRQSLLLLFCWTILPLFLVELLMIVLEPYLSQGLYQYDPDLGFKIRPYANGNNQFGFNDRDYPLQKQPENYRILILSDSFNWAGGKEGNYTALLEKQFERYYQKPNVEVINAGYPGTHTGEQLALLKKYALQYHPDLVVLGFFVGNDFIDADPNRKRIIVNDIYIDIDKRKEVKIFGYPIINQSRFLLFLQQKYKIFQEATKAKQHSVIPSSSPYQFQLVSNSSLPEKSPGILSLETFLDTEKTRLDFCKRKDLQKGVWNDNINYIFQSIDEMNQLLKQQNIQFIVAIYPDEFQVNPNLLTQITQTHKLNLANYDPTCMQNLLIPYLKTQQIAYLDFLPQFQAEQKQRLLYLLQEPHWNTAGNQLAADILFNQLLEKTQQFFKRLPPSSNKI
ncbi:hypothetical protein PCC9214_02252 [Planktothrix tepida]|uniref:AlgX/AlgJ SGNH hydrolase-like domain-containing protein n=2 Tax=Planktothrix TaxID=54304 RepID=A0A1J1LJY2_9CYAN|nr:MULTISPECIES: hypothetical protein [Planktothrix]CAD5946096.1 hypothetical protein PCC9214_02252 [Planktothrix tepida]CAD5964885.1 hypothetical protein NO713_03435 [Planktothrix pseudagardhii]CUR32791.1 conserved exported hypothetical protein [Planktothrix tepida PCC 9214]